MDSWDEFQRKLHKYLPLKDEEVFRVLRKKYLQTNKKFRHSKHCRMALDNCIQHISKNPGRIYVFLNDLKAALKLQISTTTKNSLPSTLQQDTTKNDQLESTLLSNSTSDSWSANFRPPPFLSSTDQVSVSSSLVSESSSTDSPTEKTTELYEPTTSAPVDQSVAVSPGYADDDVIILDPSTPLNNSDDERVAESHQQPTTSSGPAANNEEDSNHKKRALIVRLEHLLTRITRAIRKLEEQELDLDDLESTNSPYMQLDVLKRRYLEVWRRLCEARKVARISGRIVRRPFSFSGCPYTKVNTLIEDMVNKQKAFPDFTDVYRIVSSVNKQDGLKLSSVGVTQLSREVFIDVGHQLKRRRQADLRHDFGSHLTDNMQEENDPIYSDALLRRRLVENKHIGEAKLDSVFDKYVRLQYAGTASHPIGNRIGSGEEEYFALDNRKAEPTCDEEWLLQRVSPTPVVNSDVEEDFEGETSDSSDESEGFASIRHSKSPDGSGPNDQQQCELITISSDSELDETDPPMVVNAPTGHQRSSSEACRMDTSPTAEYEHSSLPTGNDTDSKYTAPSGQGAHDPTVIETDTPSVCSTVAVGSNEGSSTCHLNRSAVLETSPPHRTDTIHLEDSENESDSDSEVLMSEIAESPGVSHETSASLCIESHPLSHVSGFNQPSWPSQTGFCTTSATMVRHASHMTVTTQRFSAFEVTAGRRGSRSTATSQLVCHQLMTPTLPVVDVHLMPFVNAIPNQMSRPRLSSISRPCRGRLTPFQRSAPHRYTPLLDVQSGLLTFTSPVVAPPSTAAACESISEDNCIELD